MSNKVQVLKERQHVRNGEAVSVTWLSKKRVRVKRIYRAQPPATRYNEEGHIICQRDGIGDMALNVPNALFYVSQHDSIWNGIPTVTPLLNGPSMEVCLGRVEDAHILHVLRMSPNVKNKHAMEYLHLCWNEACFRDSINEDQLFPELFGDYTGPVYGRYTAKGHSGQRGKRVLLKR